MTSAADAKIKVKVRVVVHKGERYLLATDVQALILELAGQLETDDRNALTTLAASLITTELGPRT